MKKNTKYIIGVLGLGALYLYFKKKKEGDLSVSNPNILGQPVVGIQPIVNQSIYGCTAPTATNYNPNATSEDGSCQFPAQTQPLAPTQPVVDPNDMGNGLSLRTDATYEEVTSGNRRVILQYLDKKRVFHIEYNPIGTSSDERLDGKWAMVYNADHERTPNTWLMAFDQKVGLTYAKQATVTDIGKFAVYM